MVGTLLTTLYVVEWEREGIVKVGTTILPRRVHKFELRGATVRDLIHDVTVDDERAVHRHLKTIGTRTFTSWQQSVDYLGAGGGGFTECFTLPSAARKTIAQTVRAVVSGG